MEYVVRSVGDYGIEVEERRSFEMPVTKIHCKICGAGMSGYDFAVRMKKLRRHYKRKHPTAWKRAIRKGVRARAKRGK